jgi:hypothetical protein
MAAQGLGAKPTFETDDMILLHRAPIGTAGVNAFAASGGTVPSPLSAWCTVVIRLAS